MADRKQAENRDQELFNIVNLVMDFEMLLEDETAIRLIDEKILNRIYHALGVELMERSLEQTDKKN